MWPSLLPLPHFMYASIIPLGLSYFAVFSPPLGMPGWMTFLWLLFGTVLTRFSMTLFAIPHQSLVAELSDNYNERTSLQSARTVFSWMFGLLNAYLGYTVFLRPQGPGQFDPSGFTMMALFGAATIMVSITVSALATHRITLARARDQGSGQSQEKITWKGSLNDMGRAMQIPSLKVLLLASLCFGISFSLGESVANYMNLYFWGFKSHQLGVLMIVVLFAALIAGNIARPLSGRFGKRGATCVGARPAP